MDEPLHPALPWPGFNPERAFVLPLRAEFLATPFGPHCEFDGVRLQRKSEFHVTVLSREMARAAGAGCGEARLRAWFDALAWVPRRSGRYALLHETKRQGGSTLECWSLIEHLHLPAMHAFRAELVRVLGSAFAEPVPHVTHYVHGDPNGIGVLNERALAARRVRDIAH